MGFLTALRSLALKPDNFGAQTRQLWRSILTTVAPILATWRSILTPWRPNQKRGAQSAHLGGQSIDLGAQSPQLGGQDLLNICSAMKLFSKTCFGFCGLKLRIGRRSAVDLPGPSPTNRSLAPCSPIPPVSPIPSPGPVSPIPSRIPVSPIPSPVRVSPPYPSPGRVSPPYPSPGPVSPIPSRLPVSPIASRLPVSPIPTPETGSPIPTPELFRGDRERSRSRSPGPPSPPQSPPLQFPTLSPTRTPSPTQTPSPPLQSPTPSPTRTPSSPPRSGQSSRERYLLSRGYVRRVSPDLVPSPPVEVLIPTSTDPPLGLGWFTRCAYDYDYGSSITLETYAVSPNAPPAGPDDMPLGVVGVVLSFPDEVLRTAARVVHVVGCDFATPTGKPVVAVQNTDEKHFPVGGTFDVLSGGAVYVRGEDIMDVYRSCSVSVPIGGTAIFYSDIDGLKGFVSRNHRV